MRRICLLVLSLLACSRELDVPQGKALAFEPATLSAAPREALTLAATGGSPPYKYQFAIAGQGSGSDATVDATTGKYQAGSVGPAIDQLEAVDSAGARAPVRVSVGPTLVAFPPAATVAPGGMVAFVVTGGKPPYALTSASDAGGHVSGTSFVAPSSSDCTAAPFAGATVSLSLADAAGVKLPLTVNVGAGVDLRPAAGNGEVAPSETLALVASGGQPPYVAYEVTAANSGAAAVGADGTYTAGLTGDAVDTIKVTDSNGQERCLDLHIGAALSARLSTSDVRPGAALDVLASGGRAPYSFAFAFKGNRSFGSVDAVTGGYTAGPNPNTTDKILVRDATGAPAVEVDAPLGARTVTLTGTAFSVRIADVDGDGLGDIVDSDGLNTTVALTRSGPPDLQRYANLVTLVTPYDLTGNHRFDLIATGGTVASNGSFFTQPPQIWIAEANGLLEPGAELPARFGQTSAPFLAYPLPPAIPFGPTATRVMGAFSDSDNFCGGGINHLWVAHVDVPAGSTTPGALTCDYDTVFASLGMFASGDWDGDGAPDVAFNVAGSLFLMTGKSDGSFNPATAAPALSPLILARPGSFDARGRPNLRAIRPAAATADDLLALVTDSNVAPATAGVAVISPSAATEYPIAVGGQPASNFSVFTPRPGAAPMVMAVNGLSGDVEVLPYPFTASPPPALAGAVAPRDVLVEEARLGDLDGDGLPDLVIGNHLITRLEILSGDGTGTFGKRLHFSHTNQTSLAVVADVDGDGAADVLMADTQQGMHTLFSTEHQLAAGATTQMPEPSHDFALLDLDGDGTPDLVYASDAGHLFFARGRRPADGGFDPPQAIQVDWPGSGGSPLPPIYYPVRTALSGHTALFVNVGRRLAREGLLVFADATHATLYEAPATNASAIPVPLPISCAADIDGDGIPDVVMGDIDTSSNSAISYSLVKPDDPPSATWPFRAWTTVTLASFGDLPQSLGAVGARTCAFYDDQQMAFASMGPSGAQVVVIGPIGTGPVGTAFGDVTGDGKADFIAADGAGLIHVYPGDGAGGIGAESGSAVAGGTLSGVLARPDGHGDLLFSTSQDFVVVPNDGAGGFQQ